MANRNAKAIEAVRAFNRFYTGHVGALDESMLESGFSLAEVRLLYELNRHPGISAGDLAPRLRMDPAYLSRLLKRFRTAGMVAVERDPGDARRQRLTLTAAGGTAFAPLEEASQQRVAAVLEKLTAQDRQSLLAAMTTIRGLLDAGDGGRSPTILRPYRPGECASVLSLALALFSGELGWSGRFEAEMTCHLADFLMRDAKTPDGLLVVERAQRIEGAALFLHEGPQLHVPFLFVVAKARGDGLGRQLLNQAVATARAAGCDTIRVSSERSLAAARSLLRGFGFALACEEAFQDYARPLHRQVWELAL